MVTSRAGQKPGYIPSKGDVVRFEFDPHAGHEQGGVRPALVLSPQKYNRASSLAIVCPITSQVKGYPFEVPVPAGYKVTGVILADHLKSADWQARKASFICKLPDEVVEEVLDLFSAIFE
jgi:mRNA interferase MazF